MKTSTAAASAILLTAVALDAFAPSPPSSLGRRQTDAATRLSLFPLDPALATSAIESSSLVTSDLVEGLGQLALIGSVGLGVAFSKKENRDFKYEYKPGNEYSELRAGGTKDLALLEVDPVSVAEKVEEEEVAALVEPEPKLEPEPVPEPESVPEPEPEPVAVKAPSKPSKELLESTEKAKAEVQKVGVKETKEKMDAKAEPPAPAPAPAKMEVATTTSTEVAETKKAGAKRRFAKGMGLILAAGGVALARNVIKAYLGRGML